MLKALNTSSTSSGSTFVVHLTQPQGQPGFQTPGTAVMQALHPRTSHVPASSRFDTETHSDGQAP
jgi:hypothetical protein